MILTAQQQRVVDYIAAFRVEYDMSPTVREIADHLGVQLSTAQHHVEHLIRDDILRRTVVPGRTASTPRGLRVNMKAATHDV